MNAPIKPEPVFLVRLNTAQANLIIKALDKLPGEVSRAVANNFEAQCLEQEKVWKESEERRFLKKTLAKHPSGSGPETVEKVGPSTDMPSTSDLGEPPPGVESYEMPPEEAEPVPMKKRTKLKRKK